MQTAAALLSAREGDGKGLMNRSCLPVSMLSDLCDISTDNQPIALLNTNRRLINSIKLSNGYERNEKPPRAGTYLAKTFIYRRKRYPNIAATREGEDDSRKHKDDDTAPETW